MNTESQPVTETLPSIFKPTGRKPTGKIAQLPKDQRNIINRMLDDGATYEAVETEMAKHGVSLNGENISNWFQNGFQQYLQHQDHIAEMRLLRENASDLVQDYNVVQFHQAANQLAVGQIFKALTHQQLIDDPINYVRVLNALSRLSRAALVLKQCQDDDDTKTADQTTKSQPVHDLETQRKLMLAAFESATGVKAAPGPIGPDLNEYSSPEVPLTKEDASGGQGQGEVAQLSSLPPIRNQDGRTSLVSKIKNPRSPSTPDPRPSCLPAPNNPSIHQSINPVSEHCLDCRHPLPTLTPEGKRPNERCEHCNIFLPPPGTCTRPSSDKCHHCGTTLPHRLPSGRRPKYVCHNCGCGLGRETDEDTQKYAEE